MKRVLSFSLTDLHFTHIVHGMQFRPGAYNKKVLASLLTKQSYTQTRKANNAYLTTNRGRNVHGSEETINQKIKKREKSSDVSFRELCLCVSFSLHFKLDKSLHNISLSIERQ